MTTSRPIAADGSDRAGWLAVELAIDKSTRGVAPGFCARKSSTRPAVCLVPMEAAEPTYEELRDAAVAGVRWVAIAKVIGESAQLIASVILARLIVPAEFGHAAIALILVPLAAILTFEGFGSALVQRKEVQH